MARFCFFFCGKAPVDDLVVTIVTVSESDALSVSVGHRQLVEKQDATRQGANQHKDVNETAKLDFVPASICSRVMTGVQTH